MGIGESIKKGLSVTMQSLPLAGIFFLYGAATNLVNIKVSARLQGAAAPDNRTIALTLGISVVIILIGIFLQAGSMGYLRDKIKQGAASLGNFFAYGGKYYVPLLIFGLLLTLIIGVLVMLGVLAINAVPANLRIVGAIIMLLAAAAGIYFVVLMFLTPYIIVVEDEKPIAAVKRSMALVKKNILGILGIGLILVAIGFVFGMLTGIILGAVTALTKTSPGTSQILIAVLSSAVNAFLGIFMTSTYMTYYLRIKNNNS